MAVFKNTVFKSTVFKTGTPPPVTVREVFVATGAAIQVKPSAGSVRKDR